MNESYIREQEIKLEIANLRLARNYACESISDDAIATVDALGERMERLYAEWDGIYADKVDAEDAAELTRAEETAARAHAYATA